MPQVLAAVDVVVQNAGGMTSLESRAAEVPMLTYRCIAGHGETSAAALDAAGFAPWVGAPAELPRALLKAFDTPPKADQHTADPTVVDALFPVPALTA